jgi:Common central domain of tyrosinase
MFRFAVCACALALLALASATDDVHSSSLLRQSSLRPCVEQPPLTCGVKNCPALPIGLLKGLTVFEFHAFEFLLFCVAANRCCKPGEGCVESQNVGLDCQVRQIETSQSPSTSTTAADTTVVSSSATMAASSTSLAAQTTEALNQTTGVTGAPSTTVSASGTNTTASTTPTAGVCEGLGTITRKKVTSMTQAEWDSYVEAFNILTTTPSTRRPGLSIYEQFTADHDESAQHNNPLFLAWHRLMLWEWDKALNNAVPGVVQPYFEWAVSANDLFSDPNFEPSRFGGSAAIDGSAAPIPNGPWQGLTSQWRSFHLVARDFDSSPLKDELYISDLVSQVNDFGAFEVNLEHEVHDGFHIAIGGDMSSLATSPNDAFFYAHHAFIDEIYRRWQGVSSSGNTAAELDAVLEPWGMTTREVLEGISNCVVYEGSTVQANALSGSASVTTAGASSGELLFDSISQKRAAQKSVAEKKATDPAAFKAEVDRWRREELAATAASEALGAPPDRVAKAKVTTTTILLKRGVDLANAEAIANMSNSDVAAEGKAELAALESGKAPAGKENLDDVANVNA